MMTKNRDEKGRFVEGNKVSEQYTLEKAEEFMDDIVGMAMTDGCWSIDQAILDSNKPPSTYYFLMNKYADLERYKKTLDSIFIAKLTKSGLEGHVNATMAIFRQKQHGAKDKIEQVIDDKRDKVKDLFPTDDELMDE